MLDMTHGRPIRHLIAFSMPMLIGYLLQQFYVTLDMFFVGRYLGVAQVAGLGSTGSLHFMIIGFVIGMTHGMTIPISQAFGAHDEKRLRRYVAHSAMLGILIGAVMAVLCATQCMNILTAMNTPGDIIQYAYDFFVVLLWGIPLTVVYNLCSGYLRALGDAKTPLIILMISVVFNILLDIVFIPVLGFGVQAVGIATMLAQLFAATATLYYIFKKCPILHVRRCDFSPSAKDFLAVCAQGLPMGLQYSITAIGSVAMAVAVNGLGSLAVASVTCATRISFVFTTVFDALGATMATYCGQNIGAKRVDRVRKGVMDATIMGSVYAVAALITLVFLGKFFIRTIIDNPDPTLLSQAYEFLIWNSATYILLTLVNVLRFSIQGLGYSTLAMSAGVLEMIARCSVAGFLVPILGFTAVSMASPSAWLAADIFLVAAYCIITRRLARRFQPPVSMEIQAVP